MLHSPSVILYKHLKFLIMDAPSRENAKEYAICLCELGAKHLVRTCEGYYNDQIFELEGIRVHVKIM